MLLGTASKARRQDGKSAVNAHEYSLAALGGGAIAPDGSLAGLWPSVVGPLDSRVTEAIEALLPAPRA